jgi:hypothetical protein
MGLVYLIALVAVLFGLAIELTGRLAVQLISRLASAIS